MRTGGRPLGVLVPVLLAVLVALGPCSAEPPATARQALVRPRRLGAAGGRERFRLDAFGERLTLELEPDSSFLAPDFTLQYLGGPPPSPSPSSPPSGDELSRCFYSGTVNRDPGSAAALSLCAGMRGAFSLRGRQYLIQPAPGVGHRLGVHLLRRRRGTRRGDPAAAAARCAVAEPGAEEPEPEPEGPAGSRQRGGRGAAPTGGRDGACRSHASGGTRLRVPRGRVLSPGGCRVPRRGVVWPSPVPLTCALPLSPSLPRGRNEEQKEKAVRVQPSLRGDHAGGRPVHG